MRRIAAICLLTGGCQAASPVPLELRAGPGAAKDSRVSRIYEHDLCSGNIAIVRVKRLPTSDDQALHPDWAYELDKSGAVVRRWPIPVENEVIGIAGNSLFVAPATSPEANWLTVELDGSYGASNFKGPKSVERTACPAGYAKQPADRCFNVKDQSSQRLRLLSWAGPCT